MQSFVLISLHVFFVFERKGDQSSRVWKEKLDLKLIQNRAITNIFEVFEQSDESDCDLEVSEDGYKPEIDGSSDSEEVISEYKSRSNF